MQKTKETIKKAGDSLKAGAKNLADSAKSVKEKTKGVISATKTKTSNLLQKLGVAKLHPISAISDQDVETFVEEKLNLIFIFSNRTADCIYVRCTTYQGKDIVINLEDYEASVVFQDGALPNKFEKTLANEIKQKWTFYLYQKLGKTYWNRLREHNHSNEPYGYEA